MYDRASVGEPWSGDELPDAKSDLFVLVLGGDNER